MSTEPGWFSAVALMAAPVILLRRAGASWRWFGLGILSWLLGVAAKVVLTGLLHATLLERLPGSTASLVEGGVSALAELGAAAWFLRVTALGLPDALAFGAGIGAFEVLLTLLLGWLEGPDIPAVPAADPFAFVDGFFLVERALAMAGHVASRLLIYITLHSGSWLPAAVALALFSAVDGVAGYGIAANWDWEDAALMRRFLGFVAVCVGLEALAAWRFGRKLPAWRQ